VMARLVEGWVTSFIVNLSTGQPMTVSVANMFGRAEYRTSVPEDFHQRASARWRGTVTSATSSATGLPAFPIRNAATMPTI
jgi:hypothetical protein